MVQKTIRTTSNGHGDADFYPLVIHCVTRYSLSCVCQNHWV